MFLEGISGGSLLPLLLALPVFLYPIGPRKICQRCNNPIPGTDAFWNFDFQPHCDSCKKMLNDSEIRDLLAQRQEYRELLGQVISLGQQGSVHPEDREYVASRIFLGAIMEKKKGFNS